MNSNTNDLVQISYHIRTNLDAMRSLLNEMAIGECTEEKKKGFLEVMNYYIDSIINKMEQIDSDEISNNTYIKKSFDNLHFDNVKVLLVDDNDINNYVTQQMLLSYGVDVDIATSGGKAVELYKNNEYDIVFMDYLMPDMNGIETIKKIRELSERGKNQLFVGLSSYVVEAFQAGLQKLDVELIITKPIKPEQLGFILLNELRDKAAIN
ncbi:MAG: response regulator [Lachnospiraceae bacterium]|nr:response regulator [Lachnospiraceae bacterium]